MVCNRDRYPQKANRERVTKKSRENAKLFNWTGIEFPMKTTQINLFEKNNPKYAVNVLGYEGLSKLYPVKISKHYTTKRTPVNLVLISNGVQQHYVIVKNMSMLVGMQTNKHNGKSFICLNCFNTFSIEKSFKQHTEFCLSNETVRVDMPKVVDLWGFWTKSMMDQIQDGPNPRWPPFLTVTRPLPIDFNYVCNNR